MAISTNLIQIEEFEIQAGSTDIYYTTTGGLDNSLIGIYNDHYDVYPVNVEITGSGVNQRLHITYEPQTFAMNVAVLFLKGDLTINNTLTSNSETEALSAKQGKELKDLIDDIQVTGALSDLDDVTITSPSNGQALIYDNGDWVNGDVSGGGVTFPDFSDVIQTKTTISTSATYEATEDCFVKYEFVVPGNTSCTIITSDNITLFAMYSGSQLMSYIDILFIPKGTTITLTGGSYGSSVSNYTVYGVISTGGGGSDVSIKTNTTGQFNTITGGILQSCDIKLEPIQSGSGTPSPSNVRPITGHSSVEVWEHGKNLANQSTFVVGSITDAGIDTTHDRRLRSPLISVKPNTAYGFSVNSELWVMEIHEYNVNGSWLRLSAKNTQTATHTFSADAYFTKILVKKSNDLVITDNSILTQMMMNEGALKPYTPYIGYTITINLGQTVYGGSLDAVSGSGSDEWANIASYNGETITEPWLSSMDEYVSGRTPTTGAQVVYKKATASSFSTTPTQINTLIGENHLDVPLTGQSLDSLSYRKMMAWDDVERALAVKLDLSSVAPIEYTDKASQSYNQKQLFIKDNKLCQALASISSGASFTENTNFKYTTLAEIVEPFIS